MKIFKKAMISSLAFTSLTTGQNAIANTTNYYGGNNITTPVNMINGDILNLYSRLESGNPADPINSTKNIYGLGTLNAYTGNSIGNVNRIIFTTPVGFNNVSEPDPLASLSFTTGDGGNGQGSNGDSISTLSAIEANKYTLTTGSGNVGSGGDINFGGDVSIGTGGMDIVLGKNGSGVGGNNGKGGNVNFGGDLLLLYNTSRISLSAPNGKGGVVYIQGKVYGITGTIVLSLSNNAIASIGNNGADPVNVNSNVAGDNTSTLIAQNVNFDRDVIFGNSGNLGNIVFADDTYSIFQGNVTGAVTMGDGSGTDGAIMIFSGALPITFTGTINGFVAGSANLYTTNPQIHFNGVIGSGNRLNMIGIGYSIDANVNGAMTLLTK